MQSLIDRGNELLAQGYLTETIACFQQQLAITPGHIVTSNNLASALQASGRFEEANPIYLELLQHAAKPLAFRIASNYLVGLQYQQNYPATELKRITHELAAQYGLAEQGYPFLFLDDRPWRIGFLGANLCDHPVGLFLMPLLQQLNRCRFTPLLYATGGRNDNTARSLKRLATWHDVAELNHDALLARLRSDNISVLIDLSGHTAGNRLPVFARRAAPVQLSWLWPILFQTGYLTITDSDKERMEYTLAYQISW